MAEKKKTSIKVEPVPTFQLYKIDKEIDNFIETFIDKETGEIISYAQGQFNKLQMRREDVIRQIALSHLFNSAKSDVVANEIKRLQSLKRSIDNRAKLAKKIIEDELQEGETFEFENVKLSWRKSEVVEVDELTDLSQYVLDYPELIEMNYSVNKNEVKSMEKEGKPLPFGISVVKKNNLQIK